MQSSIIGSRPLLELHVDFGSLTPTWANKEQICKPVSNKKENIRKCINDKVADAYEGDDGPQVYASFEEAKAAQKTYYTECVEAYSGVTEDSSKSTSNVSEDNSNAANSNNETLNYVMTPAKDVNGNILNANTYFHGHSHIH